MTESTEQQSTWHTKLKALGPGILMASAAVGGSHIVSSTQAGAIYGW
ncbi:integral membrane protein [Streptococcus infantarius subsp. infantarius]|nr:integral membrane protein [Streptococcus infantarius subsp. infantarius]MCO4532189.1 integral membrane protein [Streptococcus infantarius subsp. infantarius]MCO4533123.1 integral membrane protein [Streptococcus infantarius subsp. infantarius]MCO4535316.1 integral membrane protein [Streptococcus infantarius subsp. infantarius]MCO4536572.1 integral membrane protein [Streptococcus infantarius subsp. infantarius]